VRWAEVGKDAIDGLAHSARNDEIGDNVTRIRCDWEAQRGALATVRRFNATLSANGKAWFWPKIAAFHAATGIYFASRWRGRVATCGARAAAGNAGGV
jgi:hypothetical protein